MSHGLAACAFDGELGTLSDRSRRGRLLTPSEETALARRIERGDRAARATMIESNLRLVFAIARPYRGRGVPFADLVQEGAVGLVHAVDRFDHRRGLKFSTYAVWWIRRSILDLLAASQVIRIPPKARRQLAAVRSAESELERTRTGPTSDAHIAERTGVSEATVRQLRTAGRVAASLDEPVGEDTTSLGELLADESAVDPSDSAIADDERADVQALLRLLPERHREVLVRRYGLDQAREQSHREIGTWLGLGEERSRQIEREALHRLRSMARAA